MKKKAPHMKSSILQLFPYIELTCTALVLFFISFLAIGIYVFHNKNKAYFNAMANMPLEDSK